MELVTRNEWGARSPKRITKGDLNDESTLHWNGLTIKVGGKTTWDHSKCAGLVRGIQNYHMDANKWNDIAYNFIPCPHGYIFEGRGLDVVNGANGTNSGNRSSHAIMNLAGAENPFTNEEKTANRECVVYISKATGARQSLKGHRDHKATACPGDERYSWAHSGMIGGGSTPTPKPNPPATDEPLLKVGSRSDSVRRVQGVLRDLGMRLAVDGMFGAVTKERVRDLQRNHGLVADGIVGPKTWAVIKKLERGITTSFGVWPTKKKPLIGLGDRGQEVRYLQEVISKKAGGNITVDGVFGDRTKRRVRDAQSVFGLTRDGIVGPKTWAVIDFLALS